MIMRLTLLRWFEGDAELSVLAVLLLVVLSRLLALPTDALLTASATPLPDGRRGGGLLGSWSSLPLWKRPRRSAHCHWFDILGTVG